MPWQTSAGALALNHPADHAALHLLRHGLHHPLRARPQVKDGDLWDGGGGAGGRMSGSEVPSQNADSNRFGVDPAGASTEKEQIT